jgi:hypothetical protein
MKQIDGFSRYSVTVDGKVWSAYKGGYMSPVISHEGYHSLNLRNDEGKLKFVKVHRLVAQTYIPNPENKPQVNHKDKNTHNNCVDNLEWVTAKENTIHSYTTGRIVSEETRLRMSEAKKGKASHRKGKDGLKGSENGVAKLNEDKVKEILTLYKNNSDNFNYYEVAKMYNVDHTNIRLIVKGKAWKHVTI